MAATTPMKTYPPGYLEEDRSPQVIGVATTFIVLLIISTALRTIARHIQNTKWMWSDIYMPISLVFNLGVCVCNYLGVRWGTGRHAMAVGTKHLTQFIILHYYGIAVAYLGAVTFSKLAILDLYLHIFIDKFSRFIAYGLGAIITASAVANFIVVMAECVPINTSWTPGNGGRCHNIHLHFVWSSLANIVTDFIMLVLPIPMIIKLHSSWKTKLGIFLTFFVGSIGLVTSIIRLIQFYHYGWKGDSADPTDITWFSAPDLIWTAVEPGMYHLAACFVTFRPLFTWLVFKNPMFSGLSRTQIISGDSITPK